MIFVLFVISLFNSKSSKYLIRFEKFMKKKIVTKFSFCKSNRTEASECNYATIYSVCWSVLRQQPFRVLICR